MCRIASLFLAFLFVSALAPFFVLAGPPFRTDDPEPVEYQHWEIYLASQYQNESSGVSMTAPHLEVNYGIWPNVQIHFIFPMGYVKPSGLPSHYGYGDTEIGIKWRFYENEETKFMIGTFPIIEVPTGAEQRGLSNGNVQVFLPLWLQKAWGPWQTYGGGGYWINPGGEGRRNFYFLGWQLQREINKYLTLGGEFFYQSPSEVDGDHHFAFNGGAIINITDNHHILMSMGTDISGPTNFFSYIAYQLTFGPEKEKEKGPPEARVGGHGFTCLR